MTWIVLLEQDLFTIGTALVLIRVLALLHKMFVHALDLNNLLTLPACGKHGAFFPVVDVD